MSSERLPPSLPHLARGLTLERLVVALTFVVIAAIALAMPAQSDTWWHLAAGRDIVASGRVLLADTWSHTAPGAWWPNYEWLAEVLMFGLHRLGGLPLVTLAGACLVVLGWIASWRLGRGPLLARALLLLLALPSATVTWSARPQLVTLALVPVVARLLLDGRPAVLALVMVAWANLHGGAAMAFVLVAAGIVSSIWTDRARLRSFVVAGVIVAAAGLATPLGWRYWPEIVLSLARSRANAIMEWQPPTFAPGWLPFWLLAALLTVTLVRNAKRVRRFEDAFTACAAALTGVVAVAALRNVPLFLLLAVPALSRLWWPAAPATAPAVVTEARGRAHAGILFGAIVLASLLVARTWVAGADARGWTPVSPTAAAAIARCPAPIYNTYADGGALIWFVPGQRVFLDSRQDPYPASLVAAEASATRSGRYEAIVARFGIRCAVVGPVSSAARAFRSAGWHSRFEDAHWIVLERP